MIFDVLHIFSVPTLITAFVNPAPHWEYIPAPAALASPAPCPNALTPITGSIPTPVNLPTAKSARKPSVPCAISIANF